MITIRMTHSVHLMKYHIISLNRLDVALSSSPFIHSQYIPTESFCTTKIEASTIDTQSSRGEVIRLETLGWEENGRE